tara:strand:+ start:400 stop:3753 length:3354 start_codon:yes stop_codon:yes gene_type:complete
MVQATDEQLLEAARSGDYSAIMNTPDRYGQIPAEHTEANRKLKELQYAGSQLLKKENAMQGVKTGDYSGATRDAQMLYAPPGGKVDYDRTLGSGSADTTRDAQGDLPGTSSRKGYAVLDQAKDADGNQYLAVSGKNSSFIVKIDADGNHERVETTSRKKGKRYKNESVVTRAFDRFKEGLSVPSDDDDTVDSDPIDDDNILDDSSDDPVSGSVEDTIENIDTTSSPIDDSVAGENFTSTVPSTEIVDIGADEVAPIDPNVSQTVVQDVAPVTYQDPVTQVNNNFGTGSTASSTADMTTSITSPTTDYVAGSVAPQAAVSGTFSQPTSTAGLSAVPNQITYKTQYAGTQGAVPENLITNAPGTGQSITTGYQQIPYENKFTGQKMTVTEFNGQPITYVPPGFTKVVQSTTGMAEGGDMNRDTVLAKKFLGFKGSPSELEGFLASNPGAAARMGKYRSAMTNRNLNVVPNQANIAGQPHRLAYVNPQEEKLLKAAGGSGQPSFGGIPTYFSLSPDPNNPPEVGSVTTDPTTGYKYTWNGTSYDITDAEGNTAGTTGGFGNTGDQGSTGQPAGINQDQFQAMGQNLVGQTMQPIQAGVAGIIPTSGDFIPVDAGQTVPQAPFAEAATADTVSVAGQPIIPTVSTADTTATTEDVKKETDALTAQTLSDLTDTVEGQTDYTTNLSDLTSASGEYKSVQEVAGEDGVPVRTLDTTTGGVGELVDGSTVDQQRVGEAFGTGEVQAASVQDELAGLMQQFEGGNTPAWAAGSMRRATAIMAQRGLGASSMAGQAIIQAAMEAALPIAQIDAGNKQQMALFKAEQRAKFLNIEFDQSFQAKVINAAKISEIANMNFNAEQQIVLENSKAANTMELANLNNKQALLMSEAAALANLEMASLNNLQQAEVQNAQNFLQMDMANLSNEQQTEIFKTQQNISAIFNDAAAENAASQFNATSENQTNQFFANLSSIVSQFNASQANAMDQFNINNINSLRKFNSEMQQQRDLFNAQNGLVIAQANAKWRQNIATLNTAAQNESNMDFAKTINALSAKNLDEIWQRERDIMSNAFISSESAMDRALQIILGDKSLESIRLQLETKKDIADTELFSRFLFGTGDDSFSLFGQ